MYKWLIVNILKGYIGNGGPWVQVGDGSYRGDNDQRANIFSPLPTFVSQPQSVLLLFRQISVKIVKMWNHLFKTRFHFSGKSCWCCFCCYCFGGFLLLFLAVFQMFDSVTNFDAQSDGERLIERANDQNNQREGRRLKLVTTAKEVDF